MTYEKRRQLTSRAEADAQLGIEAAGHDDYSGGSNMKTS